jgi:hypothetical protein
MDVRYDRLILSMDDADLEQFFRSWVEKKSDYFAVKRYTGSGDLGRDVVGYRWSLTAAAALAGAIFAKTHRTCPSPTGEGGQPPATRSCWEIGAEVARQVLLNALVRRQCEA